MVPQSVRAKALLILLSFIGMVFVSFLPIQDALHAHTLTASTQYTSIRAGDSWKGTESDLHGRNMLPVTLTITAIIPGQSDPIRGFWGNKTTLFLGHEETYAQASPGSLMEVIKVWGRSPIDRYIVFY